MRPYIWFSWGGWKNCRIECGVTCRSIQPIKFIGLPSMKLSSLLRSVKDHPGLRTPGVCGIPCECGRATLSGGLLRGLRLKEHQRTVELEHLEKSAVAEQSIDQGHHIQFCTSSVLATKHRYMAAFSGRPLRLNSTLTISTERVASVSVYHGSLLSVP
jgi:hypothetical protein